jgi:1-aminocyclopropane-1-carboxylate deaminase/D-cysteine desulfhydrase-like pyridoxal-dependent ACC family enzyme
VSRPILEMQEQTSAIAGACSRLMHTADPMEALLIDATDPEMSDVTDEERHLALLAYETEGLLFDPHYGAKALAQAVALIRQGARHQIVLWHTGGLPAALPWLAEGVPDDRWS